jgi:hypothetical protein
MQANQPSSRIRKISVSISSPSRLLSMNKSTGLFIQTLREDTPNYLSFTIKSRKCVPRPVTSLGKR